MICGSCSNSLKPIYIEGVKIHACQGGCGGLWFERNEQKKLTERPPSTGQSLLDGETVEGVRFFRNVEHACPRCQTTLLFRHFFSKAHSFGVDQCSKCGGFWLEIDKITKNTIHRRELVRTAFED